jgi:hypothetical protein
LNTLVGARANLCKGEGWFLVLEILFDQREDLQVALVCEELSEFGVTVEEVVKLVFIVMISIGNISTALVALSHHSNGLSCHLTIIFSSLLNLAPTTFVNGLVFRSKGLIDLFLSCGRKINEPRVKLDLLKRQPSRNVRVKQ